MKKFFVIPCLAVIIGLLSFSGSALAGPPEGWGVVQPGSPTTDSQPVAQATSAESDTIIIMGPPEGWG